MKIANVTRTTEPATEPLTLDQAKEHLRVVDTTDDDAYITALIKAARRYVEDKTGRTLIDTVFTQTAHQWQSCTELLRGNGHTIGSVMYDDIDNNEQTVSADDYELAPFGDGCSELYMHSTFTDPDLYDEPGAGRIRIQFTAGYGAAASNVPGDLVHAIKFMVAHLYDNRSPVGINVNLNRMPFAIDAVCSHYKIFNG